MSLRERLVQLAAAALWDLARRGLRLTPKVAEPPAQPWTHNDTEHVRQQERAGARAFCPADCNCPECYDDRHLLVARGPDGVWLTAFELRGGTPRPGTRGFKQDPPSHLQPMTLGWSHRSKRG